MQTQGTPNTPEAIDETLRQCKANRAEIIDQLFRRGMKKEARMLAVEASNLESKFAECLHDPDFMYLAWLCFGESMAAAQLREKAVFDAMGITPSEAYETHPISGESRTIELDG